MNEKEQAEEVWRRALSHPIGVNVLTDAPETLHGLLIEIRQEQNNPEMFQFTIQTKSGEVWLVRSKGLPGVKVEGAYEPIEE